MAALLLSTSIGATAQPRDGIGNWRDMATAYDRERLRGWRAAWIDALREARRAGHGADVAQEGTLLEPDAALLQPAPPPGLYRCRTIKMGGQGELLDWVSYPAFRCRIDRDGNGLTFTKLTGSQRPIGRLFADGPRRMVFLGTLQLGDERQSLRYGMDRDRDTPGVLERVGSQRWRLVLPRPAFESTLDVIELVPVR